MRPAKGVEPSVTQRYEVSSNADDYYHEDVVAVKNSFKKMLEDGVYKADLFADLE